MTRSLKYLPPAIRRRFDGATSRWRGDRTPITRSKQTPTTNLKMDIERDSHRNFNKVMNKGLAAVVVLSVSSEISATTTFQAALEAFLFGLFTGSQMPPL